MSHYFKEGYHRLALLVGPTIVHINLPQKMANNNNKMKGLLKGLRYISQIFENEKEPEMQIGFPTDVKHVAHIGWDGPSVNSPSWMNEFKSPPSFSSSPINLNGETRDGPRGGEGNRRSSRVPELPKASRRQHLAIKGGEVSASDSPTRSGKSEKARHRRSSKNSSIREASASATDSPRQGRRSMDSSDSPARISADVPKKNRRKKSKESIAGGGSSRSRNKTILASPGDRFMSPFSDPGPEPDPDKDTRTQLNCQKPQIFDDADEIKGLMT